ncbi:translation elongation factor G [Desulfuribacillus stibiiarsenatis]|uniref:Elongation factor G n=1 Tax=Desulfuribacillus stibiiarsenatis TaxID=1390249 RepID=A0A1E5L522_9FIRM|nr:elongation factor G [Desulfuribacillus stibiiarsenatis]OEH85210.1 translation elongation factor G [Desulfuribacillus stibiiarsenatis]
MKAYEADKIRNITLLGHGGSGKTSITEAALFTAKLTTRLGKTEDGNTVSDFDKEETARAISISTSLIPIEWEGYKINFLDTPGYFDFIAEAQSSIKVTGGVIITVDATSGVEVGTEKAWDMAMARNIPTFIFVNKMDRDTANFEKVLKELRETFGKKIAPFQIPLGANETFIGNVNVAKMVAWEYTGKDCIAKPIPDALLDKAHEIREMLMESVAESDEVLMDKYFGGEPFTEDEIQNGLRAGIISGSVVPVICGAANKNIGIHTMLSMITDYSPSPMDMPAKEGINPYTKQKVKRTLEFNEPFSAQVFKTIIDPYVGKISLLKMISGKLTPDTEVFNANKDEKEKISNLFILRGKQQIDVTAALAGDIVAVAKLHHTVTGDTLCSVNAPIMYSKIDISEPQLYLAIEPKAKGDEDKIHIGLTKLAEEDPSFSFARNTETKQTLIKGQGELHIKVIVSKLKSKFGVDVELSDAKVPYRETIKGTADVQGKHKKQSGGHGQYGDVKIKFEPSSEEFEFHENVFGGAVPKSYIPAVEKGLREAMEHGVLAGFPVINIKATLHDGSYHDVDSSEMAFKIAATIAFKKGIETASPVLLEPMAELKVIIPEVYMGEVMGDLNKRRGRIMGIEPQVSGDQLIIAEVPQSEVFQYATDLRSITQARGSFTSKFARYEEAPPFISEKVIAAAKNQ